jgi:hypothetical protein
MTFLKYTIWLLPCIVVAAAFFTSGIKRFRFGRLGIYFVVLFSAFLLDLQSLSFRVDRIDFALEMTVLFVIADFFWRGIRKRNTVFRIGVLALGLGFFCLKYIDWFFAGTASVDALKETMHLSTFKAHQKIFFVKEHLEFSLKKARSPNITLYRTFKVSPLEQQIDRFEVPEGYENTPLSFSWTTTPQSVSVQIIGDSDTLWTLGDPLPSR